MSVSRSRAGLFTTCPFGSMISLRQALTVSSLSPPLALFSKGISAFCFQSSIITLDFFSPSFFPVKVQTLGRQALALHTTPVAKWINNQIETLPIGLDVNCDGRSEEEIISIKFSQETNERESMVPLLWGVDTVTGCIRCITSSVQGGFNNVSFVKQRLLLWGPDNDLARPCCRRWLDFSASR